MRIKLDLLTKEEKSSETECSLARIISSAQSIRTGLEELFRRNAMNSSLGIWEAINLFIWEVSSCRKKKGRSKLFMLANRPNMIGF